MRVYNISRFHVSACYVLFFQCDPGQCRMFSCHVGTCYDVLTSEAEPRSLFSAGEDGTVRWFDLRTKDRSEQMLS